jgi:hypothetical protein
MAAMTFLRMKYDGERKMKLLIGRVWIGAFLISMSGWIGRTVHKIWKFLGFL